MLHFTASVAVNSYKKSEKFCKLIFHKLEKTIIWALFWSHLTQKIQNKIFPPQINQLNFKSLHKYNSEEKLEKFHQLIFDENRKTSFWTHFRPLLAQKPQIKILPQKSFTSILSIYVTVILSKKEIF